MTAIDPKTICFSKGNRIYDVHNLQTINLADLEYYTTSSLLYNHTRYLREETNSDERKEYKKNNLPYVTPAGTFCVRSKQGLVQPSGLMVVDIDEYSSNNYATYWKLVTMNQHVVIAFKSPSGGIKAIIRIPICNTAEEFEEYFRGFASKHSDWNIDMSGCDISRACYLSYDQNLYTNYKAITWKYKLGAGVVANLQQSEKKAKKGNHTKGKDYSPSAATFGMICTLLKDGKSKSDIWRIMDSMNNMRWYEKTEQWKDHTFKKAKQAIGGYYE